MSMAALKKLQRKRKKERQWREDVLQKGDLCLLCLRHYDCAIMRRKIIQGHHVAGRKNSPLIIPVCPSCHDVLTYSQKGWDPRWMEDDNNAIAKIAFQIRGLSDVLDHYANNVEVYTDGLSQEDVDNDILIHKLRSIIFFSNHVSKVFMDISNSILRRYK